MQPNTLDRSAQAVWFWLAIVGIVLLVVGWFRYAF
jgi:hypothetical protein